MMRTAFLAFPCTALIFTAANLAAQGTTATVNDGMSHGTVGDASLSLDEAIRLASGSLRPTALSTLERAQLAGIGNVDRIEVDAGAAATITVERPLSDIANGNALAGGSLVISGGTAGTRTTLNGGSVDRVFTLRTRFARIEGFDVTGGRTALDVAIPASGMPMPPMPVLADCQLSAQLVSSIVVSGIGMDEPRLMVMRSGFDGSPIGITIDDNTVGGSLMVEFDIVEMDGVTLGAQVTQNGDGPASALRLFRTNFINGETLARVRRSSTSGRRQMLRFVHTDANCSADVVDIEGTPAGPTVVHHHHGDFIAASGRKALFVWPRTADFDIHGSEMLFDGDVDVTGNALSQRFWHQNNVYRNGTVTFDVDGALPNLLWNRYEDCTIRVPSAARSPLALRSSELVRTDVDGGSLLAPVTLTGCWRNGGQLTGFATDASPAPARFLGSTSVSSRTPALGSNLMLSSDVPPGVGLLWNVLQSESRPTTTNEPVRFYGLLTDVGYVPGLYALQSTISIPIPNDPTLVGVEFYVQGVSIPLFGANYVPSFHLPRGTRVTPRL